MHLANEMIFKQHADKVRSYRQHAKSNFCQEGHIFTVGGDTEQTEQFFQKRSCKFQVPRMYLVKAASLAIKYRLPPFLKY